MNRLLRGVTTLSSIKILLPYLLLLAFSMTLSGCASSPRMARQNRERLKNLSTTVIYVTPASSASVGAKVSWNNVPFGPHGSDALGFFLGGFLYTGAQAYYRHEAFAKNVGKYKTEIKRMDIPRIEKTHAWSALHEVKWLHDAKFETLSYDGHSDFVHRTVLKTPTQAVIFIYPGSFISDNAKAVGMSYAVVSYVRIHASRVLVRELDSGTVSAQVAVEYPEKYSQFNELTAPTTTAAAWRLEYLFAGKGTTFFNTLAEAIQQAGWKLKCYLAEHCATTAPKGFGFAVQR